MPVVWNNSMSTGVPEVDRQHQDLIGQLNRLNEAMSQGKGRDEIAKMLDFLADYVVRHFAAEERHMDVLGCPAAAANRQAHREFLGTFKALRERFDAAGAQPTLVLEIHGTLSKWLVGHITKIDTQLSACAVHA